jgi:hypothetical protein
VFYQLRVLCARKVCEIFHVFGFVGARQPSGAAIFNGQTARNLAITARSSPSSIFHLLWLRLCALAALR